MNHKCILNYRERIASRFEERGIHAASTPCSSSALKRAKPRS